MTLNRMTEIQSEPPSPRRPARERLGRTWTVTAAAIVALIILAAVVVIFATRGGDKAPAASPRKPSPAAPSAARGRSAPSLPAQDQTVPTSPPAGVTWSLFQGVALASSATAGPARVDGPVYSGYAHTPVGALLAANQIGVRYLLTPGNGWRRVVEQQVVPGPGRDVFIVNRAKVTTTEAAPGTYGQLAGFRFVTYTPDVSVIQFVTRFSSGTLQVTTSTMQWASGDWKLQLQPDGGSSPTAQRIDNLSGYVPWGGL